MKSYEASATVQECGHVHVAGVPFAPGTEVEITISPKAGSQDSINVADETQLASARARMQELFRSVKGFRMAPKIPREELYERGSLR